MPFNLCVHIAYTNLNSFLYHLPSISRHSVRQNFRLLIIPVGVLYSVKSFGEADVPGMASAFPAEKQRIHLIEDEQRFFVLGFGKGGAQVPSSSVRFTGYLTLLMFTPSSIWSDPRVAET